MTAPPRATTLNTVRVCADSTGPNFSTAAAAAFAPAPLRPPPSPPPPAPPPPPPRGLHSFPSQLNLSSSVHLITQINS